MAVWAISYKTLSCLLPLRILDMATERLDIRPQFSSIINWFHRTSTLSLTVFIFTPLLLLPSFHLLLTFVLFNSLQLQVLVKVLILSPFRPHPDPGPVCVHAQAQMLIRIVVLVCVLLFVQVQSLLRSCLYFLF